MVVRILKKMTTTATAWDSNGLIPDVFVDPLVKDHLISTFVLSQRAAQQLSEMFDYSSVRRRMDTCVRLISGRVATGQEQQQQAIHIISTNFNSRSKEFQDAVIDSVPSLQTFKQDHLQAVDNSTILSLYLATLNNQNTDVHQYAHQSGLTAQKTTAQRKQIMQALNHSVIEYQADPHRFHTDFAKLCQLLMPNYYTVEGACIVQAGR